MKPDSELLAWFGLSRADSNWRSDWREIANCFIKSGIRYLYHFTDRANVSSILYHGLISKSEISRLGLASRMSSNSLSRELDQKKGTYNYVFLSIREDPPMLYDKLNRGIEAVILRVNSSAAFEKGVKWCDSNSTKNNSKISDSINDLGRFDFSSIRSVKQYPANSLEKDRRQAEILVPSKVAPALITGWRSPERKNSWQTINAQPQSTRFKAADRTPTTQTNSPTKTKPQASVTPKVQQKPKATYKPIPITKPTPAKKRHSNRSQNKTQLFTQPIKPRATRNTNRTKSPSSARMTPADSDRQIEAANSYGILAVCLMAAIIPALVLISSLNKRESDPKETQPRVVVVPERWYMGDVRPKDTSSPNDKAFLEPPTDEAVTSKSKNQTTMENDRNNRNSQANSTQVAKQSVGMPEAKNTRPNNGSNQGVSSADSSRSRTYEPQGFQPTIPPTKEPEVELSKVISDLERALRLKVDRYRRYSHLPNSQKPQSIIELGRELQRLDQRISELKRLNAAGS